MPANLSSSGIVTALDSSIRGLYATPTTPLHFLSGVVVRSFVLEREHGNVIIYNSPGITAAAQEIRNLGRPTRLLVNHWHEAMYSAPDLDVPIFVHDLDRDQTDLPLAGSFSKWERIDDDLDVIPTPGHTAGTTMFLWDTGKHRILFPGDTIWVQGGEWKAVLLDEDAREAYLASLSLIGDLEIDFLIPWGSEEGQPYGYGISKVQARERLGRIVARLRDGENA